MNGPDELRAQYEQARALLASGYMTPDAVQQKLIAIREEQIRDALPPVSGYAQPAHVDQFSYSIYGTPVVVDATVTIAPLPADPGVPTSPISPLTFLREDFRKLMRHTLHCVVCDPGHAKPDCPLCEGKGYTDEEGSATLAS